MKFTTLRTNHSIHAMAPMHSPDSASRRSSLSDVLPADSLISLISTSLYMDVIYSVWTVDSISHLHRRPCCPWLSTFQVTGHG